MTSQIFIKSVNYNLIHDSRLPLIWQMCQISVFLSNNRVVNLIGRVKLGQWLFILPDLVLGAETISPLSLRSRKAVRSPNPSLAVVLFVDTRATGRCFQVMAISGRIKFREPTGLFFFSAFSLHGIMRFKQTTCGSFRVWRG